MLMHGQAYDARQVLDQFTDFQDILGHLHFNAELY